MSTQQHQTALQGYEGPFFPDIDTLNRAIDSGPLSNASLREICTAVNGHVDVSLHGVTADGYTWFSELTFQRADAKVAILIPWSQDWNKRDGSQQDRSCAVYVQGMLPKDEQRKLVEELSTAITRYHAKPDPTAESKAES